VIFVYIVCRLDLTKKHLARTRLKTKTKTETEKNELLREAQSGDHHDIDMTSVTNYTNETALYDGKGARKTRTAV